MGVRPDPWSRSSPAELPRARTGPQPDIARGPGARADLGLDGMSPPVSLDDRPVIARPSPMPWIARVSASACGRTA